MECCVSKTRLYSTAELDKIVGGVVGVVGVVGGGSGEHAPMPSVSQLKEGRPLQNHRPITHKSFNIRIQGF